MTQQPTPFPHDPVKLEPLRLRTLAETRATGHYGRGDVAVYVPRDDKGCWAEVREPGTGEQATIFRGCERAHREGYLTCLVHYNREFAARELKCEADGVQMDDIAYADETVRAAHHTKRKATREAWMAARKQGA